ncbi:MAG: immune inhibitor A domain-containing protein, partial [Thermoplasmata archaeon]
MRYETLYRDSQIIENVIWSRRLLIPLILTAILFSGCTFSYPIQKEKEAETKYVEGPLLHPPNPEVYNKSPFVLGPSSVTSLGTRSDPVERLVAILIDFQDVTHLGAHSVGYYDQLIFDASGSGSVYDYYREASYNQLRISGDVAPTWYKSSKPIKEYGKDSAGGVDDFFGPIYRLVVEAVQLADPDVDFSNYDEDGDGLVDHLIVIHAGEGQESSLDTNSIWSHHWAVIDA